MAVVLALLAGGEPCPKLGPDSLKEDGVGSCWEAGAKSEPSSKVGRSTAVVLSCPNKGALPTLAVAAAKVG